jgi:hypothetical protein
METTENIISQTFILDYFGPKIQKLESGNKIFCSRVFSFDGIIPGRLYLLSIGSSKIVRMLKSGAEPNTYIAHHDDPEKHPDIDLRADQIQSIFEVEGMMVRFSNC